MLLRFGFFGLEREEAVGVWNHIQAHPETIHSWSNAAGSAAYTVHPGQVDGCYFAVFKDAREHGELVAALNHNKYLQRFSQWYNRRFGVGKQGKVIDSNPQLWRVIGVSNAGINRIDLENLLGVRNWKRLAVRLGEVIEFEFVNLLGQQLVVEGRMSQVGQDSESFALALLDITEKRKISQDLFKPRNASVCSWRPIPLGCFWSCRATSVMPTKQVWKSSPFKKEKCTTSGSRIFRGRRPSADYRGHGSHLIGEKTTYLEVSILQANGKARKLVFRWS